MIGDLVWVGGGEDYELFVTSGDMFRGRSSEGRSISQTLLRSLGKAGNCSFITGEGNICEE